MKGLKKSATGIAFTAVLGLSLVATSGQAFAASPTRPARPVMPFVLIKIVLQPFGISWED
jgi:hypothetical protein